MAKRRLLNREIVIARAAEMVDAAGQPDTLRLYDLAAALDVRPPSLYNHIASLDDLHHALALYGVQRLLEALRGAAVGQVGRAALLALADAYRRFAHEHPGLYPLTLRAPDADDAAHTALSQELLHLLFLLLASMGLEGDEATHAVRGLRALLHGFVSLEVAEGFKMPVDRDESFRRLLATYLDGLAPRTP